MKKLFFSLLGVVCLVMMVSCDGKMSATAYNAKVVKIHSDALTYFNDQLDKMSDEDATQEERKAAYDSLAFHMNEWYNTVNELKYPDVADDFHQAIINYFVYEKDTLLPALKNIVDCKPGSNEWTKMTQAYDKLTDRDEKLNDIAQQAQVEFASKVDMELK